MATILSFARQTIAACTVALLLSACGGGGDGDTAGTAPTPTNPTPTDPTPGGPTTSLPAGRTVATGVSHSLFVKTDGTVWAVGENLDGQLGDGSTTNSSTAVQVSGLTGVTAVVAGDRFSLALRSDGTVWAWGVNDAAQLGDGSSAVLLANGTLRAWGDNRGGMVGDGTYTGRVMPHDVMLVKDITSLSTGHGHSLAVTVTGQQWG